jgi:hypothetical protein
MRRLHSASEDLNVAAVARILLTRILGFFGIRTDKTPQGLRMLLDAFRGGNPLGRIVGISEMCSVRVDPG